ncbi:hypothetical protein HDU76_009546 [Blyttiomyces sp. JEL0837]|nr:hypothetical protein HDU76_009546 [Blyttiomyces sp. JEL0837]
MEADVIRPVSELLVVVDSQTQSDSGQSISSSKSPRPKDEGLDEDAGFNKELDAALMSVGCDDSEYVGSDQAPAAGSASSCRYNKRESRPSANEGDIENGELDDMDINLKPEIAVESISDRKGKGPAPIAMADEQVSSVSTPSTNQSKPTVISLISPPSQHSQPSSISAVQTKASSSSSSSSSSQLATAADSAKDAKPDDAIIILDSDEEEPQSVQQTAAKRRRNHVEQRNRNKKGRIESVEPSNSTSASASTSTSGPQRASSNTEVIDLTEDPQPSTTADDDEVECLTTNIPNLSHLGRPVQRRHLHSQRPLSSSPNPNLRYPYSTLDAASQFNFFGNGGNGNRMRPSTLNLSLNAEELGYDRAQPQSFLHRAAQTLSYMMGARGNNGSTVSDGRNSPIHLGSSPLRAASPPGPIMQQPPSAAIPPPIHRLIPNINMMMNLPPPVPEPEEPAKVKCAVCQCTPDKDTQLSATVCGHIFCESCLKECVKKAGKKCPTCRKSLAAKNAVHRLYL